MLSVRGAPLAGAGLPPGKGPGTTLSPPSLIGGGVFGAGGGGSTGGACLSNSGFTRLCSAGGGVIAWVCWISPGGTGPPAGTMLDETDEFTTAAFATSVFVSSAFTACG